MATSSPRYRDMHKRIASRVGFQHPNHYAHDLIKPARKTFGVNSSARILETVSTPPKLGKNQYEHSRIFKEFPNLTRDDGYRLRFRHSCLTKECVVGNYQGGREDVIGRGWYLPIRGNRAEPNRAYQDQSSCVLQSQNSSAF
jgi:hypothetical protein